MPTITVNVKSSSKAYSETFKNLTKEVTWNVCCYLASPEVGADFVSAGETMTLTAKKDMSADEIIEFFQSIRTGKFGAKEKK